MSLENKTIGYNPLNTIPRDITAKKVVFDEGEHYNPKIKSDKHIFCTKIPPIRDLNTIPFKVKNDPNFKILINYKVGYFTVIGLFFCSSFDKWVVRCSCGNYEVRTAKTLKKISGKKDQIMCQACLDTERIRNREYWKIHGIYPWQAPAVK